MKKIIISLLALLAVTAIQANNDYAKYYQNLPVQMPQPTLPTIPDNQVSILDCGGKGDGLTLNTEAFAKAISQLTKQDTKLITNRRCSDMLGGKGQVMKNGDSATIGEWNIEAVPAYNTSKGKEQFHPKGRDNGFVLTIDGFRIYIAGDTEDIDEMKDISDIDVAFLPCNQPFTMTPEQVAKATKTIHPKVLFPYHYGNTDIRQVRTLLKDSSTDVRIRQYQ